MRITPFQDDWLYRHTPRTRPTSLASLLREWGFADHDLSAAGTAEQLSQWLSPLDGVALHAAHRSIQAAGQTMPTTRQGKHVELGAQYRHLHDALLSSLAWSEPLASGHGHGHGHAGPAPAQRLAASELTYTRFRQHHIEQQRLMARQIDAFRCRCRQVLAQTSRRLRQLAELDLTLQQLLAEREGAMLSKLPALLERRFQSLKALPPNTCNPALSEARLIQAESHSQLATWTAIFQRNFQEALQAELMHRLSPVTGMVDAFDTATLHQP